ncbi:MAG TPA: hypothetical protein VGN63_21505 [Flavisolibacter sp.]|jgi:hypothetical protein|nr:hypothetical protein [Flavisolibacter sp.]
MIENQQKNKTGLLPHYCKKIGVAVMVLAFIPLITIKSADIQIAQGHKELLRLMAMNMFILGLLFVAWAKDKVEDETTIALRLKSLGFAFIWATLLVILKPFTDVIFKNPIEVESAQGLVISMLFFHLLLYHFQKKGRQLKNTKH